MTFSFRKARVLVLLEFPVFFHSSVTGNPSVLKSFFRSIAPASRDQQVGLQARDLKSKILTCG